MQKINLLRDEFQAGGKYQALLLRTANSFVRKVNDKVVWLLALAPATGFLVTEHIHYLRHGTPILHEPHDYIWLAMNLAAGCGAAYHIQYLLQINKKTISRLESILSDRSMRMKRERILRKEKQQLAAELDKRIFFIEDLLSAVPIGILYRDETGKYIYANEEIGRILSVSVDEIIGKQVSDIFPPDILQTTMESDERVQLTKKPTSDQISYGPEGQQKSYTVRKIARYTDLGVFSGTLMVVIDNDDLYRLSTTDELTGLANRRQFLYELRKSIERTNRSNGGKNIALAIIDANKFKLINDTHGHIVGDEVLKGIASILSHHVRKTDIVARLGGDEFAIILLNITSMDNVMEMMQKIVDDIDRSSITVGDKSISLCSVSIGTTVFPNRLCGEVSTAEAEAILYNQADVAMYKAKALSEKKETQKGTIVSYDE